MIFRRLAACLCLCALLGGCAQDLPEENVSPGALLSDSAASQEPAQTRGPLLPEVFSLPYNAAATLDPVTCPDGAQQVLTALLYEGLFRLNQGLEPENVLCAAAEYDPERLTWTLRPREDVLFSDGSPLSAADVSATLRRAMTSRRYQARLSCVKSVRTGRGAVIVTLNRANTGFLSLLDIPIVKSGTEDDPVPLGTGPYVLTETEDGPCLTANDGWWRDDSLPARQIGLVDCAGEDEIHYQFTTHAIQLITTDLTGMSFFNTSGDIDAWEADTTVFQYIGFNLNREALRSPAARRALGTGIDREALAGLYLAGHALPAQFPVSPASPLYPENLEETYSYDGFAAAMTAAGLNTGAEIPLTLLVNSENSFKVTVANYLAAALSDFDWKITVDPRPWAEYQAALAAGDYDLFYGEARLTADWDLTALAGTGGSLNFGGFSDPVLDEDLAAYAASERRGVFLSAVCARLRWQSPILPLCFKQTAVLTQADTAEGFSPTGADPFYGIGGIAFHLRSGLEPIRK